MSALPEFSTKTQTSAGGVAFRQRDDRIEIVIISVGGDERWQLPKGRVDEGETTEETALREVREEAGVDTVLVAPIDTIDYWFFASHRDRRVRIHKFVNFYLLRFVSGDPEDHDFEVNEARWEEIGRAAGLLAFDGERNIVERAKEMIQAV